jgi:predicted Rossmann fold nucleotide-binding protein DprA/Smf involved in DNA uptake
VLKGEKVALFCSARCPGDLILKAYDLAKKLRDDGVTVISGFHSPIEKECLRILLRGKQPLIICPARSLANLRVPTEWKRPRG